MLHDLKAWIFPPSFKAQVLLGFFLVMTFLLPARLAVYLWPSPFESDIWKVAAVMIGGTLFTVFYLLYMYFGLMLAQHESEYSGSSKS